MFRPLTVLRERAEHVMAEHVLSGGYFYFSEAVALNGNGDGEGW
jgi:hypothetical protein